MSNVIYAIYGTGGCGRGVLPVARQQLGSARLVFIDDTRRAPINGHEVLQPAEFFARPEAEKCVAIAIAAPGARAGVAARCAEAGARFFEVRAATHVRMDDVEVGDGALISPFATFTSNIRIGAHFHANLYSYVEHDCFIGDFVTFAPGVQCNGNVRIGNGAYIGAGAMIRQGLEIGAGAVVGMGAVVTCDVPPGVTVAGNPARPLR